ncbi:MAG: hypothetical protein ACFFCT_14575 [Candidatus Odinarchaeota archaeon]
MTEARTNIWELIELYRKSKFYTVVLNEAYLARYAGIHLGSYVEESDDEFLEDLRELLTNDTTLGEKKVKSFLENNSVDKIRSAFELFLAEEIEPIGFIDTFLKLKNCDLYFASQLLGFASEGFYITCNDVIYKAMIELFPDFEGNPSPVKDGVSYMYFQMACDVIMQTYRFTSVQELHWFLWHGNRTDWKFI